MDPTTWGEIVFDTYYGDPGSPVGDDGHPGRPGRHRSHGEHPALDSATWVKRYYEDGLFAVLDDRGRRRPAERRLRPTQPTHSQRMAEGRQRLQGLELHQCRDRPALRPALVAVRRQPPRQETLREICRIHAEEQPYVQLWATTRYWFINNRIGNFVSTPGPAGGNYYAAPNAGTSASEWPVTPSVSIVHR